MTFEAAQKVADAVLYEGYVLYPYHASSDKNRVRFQFGVVAPMDFSLSDGTEAWEMQTECLVSTTGDTRIDVRIRFLQLQARLVEAADATADSGFAPVGSLEVSGQEVVSWDEAVERHIDHLNVSLADLCEIEQTIPFSIDGGREVEHAKGASGDLTGRVVRTRWPIEGLVRLSAERFDGLVRLRVRIENRTSSPLGASGRDEALRRSLLGCHTLIAVTGGALLSLIDPPVEAQVVAKGCVNLHTWPVLVGESGSDDLILSSPIILYDHPTIAPESQGDLFDSTEIDEILTLRIMTLSDAEKRAARATDPRARAIIDAADDMPPEIFDRLHGAIRYLRETPGVAAGSPEQPMSTDEAHVAGARVDEASPDPAAAIQPWSLEEPDWPVFVEPRSDRVELPSSVWEPAARVVPERAAIQIDGMTISKGASVRLRPNRPADSMDIFLVGRTATVEAVFESVDDDTHVAVTIDDDPAADLQRASGRFFYFRPDELEPLAPAPPGSGPGPVVLEPSARSLAGR